MADRLLFYYVEYDGMVYLVEREGRLRFPTRDEVPCEIDERVRMTFETADVVFALPRIDAYPRDWTFKDKVPALANVDPLVQRAINASLVREVVGVLVLDGGKLLMVKASRGYTKGMWNMPGGFVQYGETPEESAARETKEETGLDIKVESLVGVYTERFGGTYFTRGHVFVARPITRTLALAPDEIAEAAWMAPAEAYATCRNPFFRQALDKLGLAPK